MLQAVEDKYQFGLPTDAGAVLIIEVDGLEVTIQKQSDDVVCDVSVMVARERFARPITHLQNDSFSGDVERKRSARLVG